MSDDLRDTDEMASGPGQDWSLAGLPVGSAQEQTGLGSHNYRPRRPLSSTTAHITHPPLPWLTNICYITTIPPTQLHQRRQSSSHCIILQFKNNSKKTQNTHWTLYPKNHRASDSSKWFIRRFETLHV